MRGVWVDAFGEGIRSPAEVEALVSWAASAGVDALVVQVLRRGDAFANDLPVPRADGDLAPAPFDPLAAVCERAAADGVAVHAWLGATPVAQGVAPAARFDTLLSRRADGADRDRHGIAHLDPGHPAARTFVAECAAAVSARYPVDGVNLDRVRYPESDVRGQADWGYNPEALARFADDTGATSAPHPTDLTWQSWRREQVTALVAETAAAVRDARAGVAFTTTGTCFGSLEEGWEASRPWVECGQDWPGWLARGLVDGVLVMDYRGDADDADLVVEPPADVDLTEEGTVAAFAEPSRLQDRFDAWARLAVGSGGQRAVIGTGLYLHDTERNAIDARRALSLEIDGARAGGWCGYSYRTPSRSVLRGQQSPDQGRAELAAVLRDVLA